MISVCLASHNGMAFLERQIASILPQLGEEDELLVGDDGSTDGTLEWLGTLRDPRLRILSGRCGGPILNFGRLLGAARGDWIVLSDQDDEWLPGRIAILTEVPDQAMAILCDAEVVDGNGHLLHASLLEAHGVRHGVLANLFHNRYTGCCLALRRAWLSRCHPFPAGIGMHDWWIGLCAEQDRVAHWVLHPLVRHVRHGGNASSEVGRSRLSLGQILSMRIRLAALLLLRR